MTTDNTHVATEETLARVYAAASSGQAVDADDLDYRHTHVATEETLLKLASLIEAGSEPIYDETTGRYDNDSIRRSFAATADGKLYSVAIPMSGVTACIKMGAHAGWDAPTPGYASVPAIDPYESVGPFRFLEVNGGVDEDGAPYVTAIRKLDDTFARDGSNGDVWIETPTLYWSFEQAGSYMVLSVSDTCLPGLSPQPQAKLPDDTLRPFIPYAKYIGVRGADGYMHSYSGYGPWAWAPSHNNLITECRNGSTGYSGKSIADDWYVKTMFLLKYATLNSQSVFSGCTTYNYQYSPAVAETGVTRVILTNAQAANLIVGSSCMLGTHTASSADRGQSYNHDVFDNLKITAIETYDSDNMAVYFDTETAFDVETSYLLSTAPWQTGSLDAIEGDGTITLAGRTNNHEPFAIQGIETAMGIYEILGDVILSSDGATGWQIYVNYDSRNESTSLTDDYTSTGKCLPSGDTDAWHYPLYPEDAGGLLCGLSEGASTTTGLCDGTYTLKTSTSGLREWLGLGNLSTGANTGLFCVHGTYGLGSATWIFGSRLSGTGRSRAAA